jgi:hypothetical protein
MRVSTEIILPHDNIGWCKALQEDIFSTKEPFGDAPSYIAKYSRTV